MADLTQLENALRKADAAGDTYAASRFAQEIRAMQPQASKGDIIAGMPVTRFAMGAASPIIGAAQLGAHAGDAINEMMGVEPMVSPWIDKQLKSYEEAKHRGMKAAGNEGYDWMGLFGSIVPSGMAAKSAVEHLPQAVQKANTLGSRVLQGATAGSTAAALQPAQGDSFAQEKATQIGAGGVLGAAPPLISQALSGVKAVFEPFYQAGRDKIIGRTLQEAAGGQEQKVLQSLQNAKELVPGSAPTAAQAALNPGISTLDRAASAISPPVKNAFQVRENAQDAARQKLLGSVAQNDSALASAVSRRAQEAAGKYGAAGGELVQPDAALNALLSRPSMKSVLPRAQSLIEEQGKTFRVGGSDPIPVSDLHAVKMAMDDLIKNPERFGIGGSEAKAMTKTQEEFLKWLGAKSPAYTEAREAFKAASVPINQMEVGQAIRDKSVNPLTEKLMPQKYGNALSDRTAQSTLGRDEATLKDVFTPEQLQSLESVKADLARMVAARDMGGTRGSDTISKLAYSNMIDRAGVPTFLREFAPTQTIGNFMARGADTVYGRANKEIADQLAMTLLDPQRAATAMQSAVPSRYAPLIDALIQQASSGAGVIAGRGER